jgi:hypothetical protein
MSESSITELAALKAEATKLGVDFHPSIGLDKLQEKVDTFVPEDNAVEVEPAAPAKVTKQARINKAKAEAGKLIRINAVCMNPAKKDWAGEIYTTGNNQIGTFRKFVQFNTDDGFHVPSIIFEMMKERKFQQFKTEKTSNGVSKRVGKLVTEFAIQVLDPLTKEELAELAKVQAARG